MIGCGTAYNSCLTAKYWFEELTTIDVEIDIASEFRYRKLKFNSKNLYIFVSQSGETADTAAALNLCKKNKVKTCAIVNVIESTIARNSDWVLPIHAGTEIGVASTKAFLGQLTVLYILCLKLAITRKDIDVRTHEKNINNLKKLPEAIKECINNESNVQLMAKEFLLAKGSMFLGRGSSFPIALEGALKLKELSYLPAAGYPAHLDNLLSPILLTLPLQMLAYHVALLKNCDVDKPRNLAKSVTVE